MLGGAGATRPRVARLSHASQLRLPYDEPVDEHFYHRTPSANTEGIRQEGFDPGRRQRGSFGTHFSPNPNDPWQYADEATSKGGESGMLRVRREHVPDVVQNDPHDFHTEHRISPEHIEAYVQGEEGMPGRWEGLTGTANDVIGLMGLLTAIPGVAKRFDRTAWLLNGGPLGDAMQRTIGESMQKEGLHQGSHLVQIGEDAGRLGHSIRGRSRARGNPVYQRVGNGNVLA